jgi:hypothetical protein
MAAARLRLRTAEDVARAGVGRVAEAVARVGELEALLAAAREAAREAERERLGAEAAARRGAGTLRRLLLQNVGREPTLRTLSCLSPRDLGALKCTSPDWPMLFSAGEE